MTDIKNILAKHGITVPEDKQADFTKDFNENYKTISEVNKIITARDTYKSQLDTAQTTLKSFEGVNVEELQGKVTKLTNDLANKETEFNAKMADIEFNNWLDGQLTTAKAKNLTAVKALFDTKALKDSKTRDTDFASALEKVKTENGYLFDDGKTPQITVPGNPAPTPTSDAAYRDAYYQNNPFYKKT